MATFTPPVAQDIPPILPESRGDARRLFRYYPSRKRYIAVFKLSDGTYVQDTASPENSNTNIPYPWNPDQPSAPYVSSKYYDYTLGQYVTEELSISPYILFVYLGVTTVSSTEAAALTAAGYGDCIS